MNELELYEQCIPDIAEIVVNLQEKTPEQRERFKNECVEYASSVSTLSREYIIKVLIVIDKHLKKSA